MLVFFSAKWLSCEIETLVISACINHWSLYILKRTSQYKLSLIIGPVSKPMTDFVVVIFSECMCIHMFISSGSLQIFLPTHFWIP